MENACISVNSILNFRDDDVTLKLLKKDYLGLNDNHEVIVRKAQQ
jgi:hypothetical protein